MVERIRKAENTDGAYAESGPGHGHTPTAVLFMQTQDFFGADSQIHASIMKHLDPERFSVHCAVPIARGNEPVASAEAVGKSTTATLRPTNFGPSLDHSSKKGFVRDVVTSGFPAVISLIGLTRYARRVGVSIVHCTEKPRDVVYGMLIARLCGASCVIHVHVKAETWIRAAVREAMHRASALIGVSEFVAGSIRDLGYEPTNVHSVLNGLELDDWIHDDAGAADRSSRVREEFGVPESAPLLVSASRLYRYKGQHELLAALPTVKDSFPNVKVLIVGEDDPRSFDGNVSYTAELRSLCDELDLCDNVVFTGFRSDVRDLMAASDLYVMPSFEEPFGMVFTEAMSLRKPVVALNNGGTKEVVEHGVTGLLSEPDDTEQLAVDIVTLLSDRDLREQMGEKGRQRVIESLHSGRMARDIEQVYTSIVA